MNSKVSRLLIAQQGSRFQSIFNIFPPRKLGYGMAYCIMHQVESGVVKQSQGKLVVVKAWLPSIIRAIFVQSHQILFYRTSQNLYFQDVQVCFVYTCFFILVFFAVCLLGRDQLKKNVFLWALPELPNPPPPDPNSGNLVLFFRKSKLKI